MQISGGFGASSLSLLGGRGKYAYLRVSGNPMTTQYYKRHFEEVRTKNSESWGTCEYYFETNQVGEVLRQIEVYENGKTLKYSEQFIEDEFGFLADQPLDLFDFEKFAITKNDFEYQWQK